MVMQYNLAINFRYYFTREQNIFWYWLAPFYLRGQWTLMTIEWGNGVALLPLINDACN